MWQALIGAVCAANSAVATAGGGTYLDVPRIHMAGRFYTDPSTVNNDPHHYEPDVTKPSPWQEPEGAHNWQLRDCTVRSVVDRNGRSVEDDPIIGAAVGGTDEPGVARIVDLDVYQQGVSTIYGFQLEIALGNGAVLIGNMDPATLNGAWFARVLPTRGWNLQYGWGSYGADNIACGVFVTRVRVDVERWPTDHGSSVLDELRAASDVVDGQVLLSFRFVLDDYQNVPSHQDFRLGRFSGALGPGRASAPEQTSGRRWLEARALPQDAEWYVPTYNSGPFMVDERRRALVIDLANSMCQQKPGGPVVDVGDLDAVVVRPDGSHLVIGAVDYSQFVYENQSGIAELALTDDALEHVRQRPLALVAAHPDGPDVVMSEDSTGLAYAANERVVRMTSEPGSQFQEMSTTVHVTRWGQPAEGVHFALTVIPVTGTTPGNTGTPGSAGDTVDALGVLDASIDPSGADGTARVMLRAVKDPFSRTAELDGQLYFVYVHLDREVYPDVDVKTEQSQERQISVLVWSRYEVNDDPTWEEVQELFAPYARLYPSMTDLIDLTDRHAFEVFADNPPWPAFGAPPSERVMGLNSGAIPYFMTRDITDPRYMPITRDLSPNKVRTILNWIRNQQPRKESAKANEGQTQPATRDVAGSDDADEPAPVVPDALPFLVEFEEIEYASDRDVAPLQSYTAAVTSDGGWLVFGGRTVGLHTFEVVDQHTPPQQGNFPPSAANHFMYVVDPEAGVVDRFDVRSLRSELAEPLQATNQQSYHDAEDDELYVVGGYGAQGSESGSEPGGEPGGRMVTFDTIIRMSPDAVARIVTSDAPDTEKAHRLEQAIEIARDERLRVTGGALHKLGPAFYLVFGQSFMGQYSTFGAGERGDLRATLELRGDDNRRERTDVSPAKIGLVPFDQKYTDEVRVFTLRPDALEILSYGATRNESDDLPFHRRDGNIIRTVDPRTGATVIKATGGVFPRGKIAGFTQPIVISAPGLYEIDRSFDQLFSQYECPVISVYAPSSGTVYHTFFGGISHGYYHQTPKQREVYDQVTIEGRNDGLPFICDISTIAQTADGTSVEWIHPRPIPGHRLLGASARYLSTGAATCGGEVVDLDAIAKGERVVIGYIYGGIDADFPLPVKPNGGTQGSSTVFRVTLTHVPAAAIPAKDSGKSAEPDKAPLFRWGH